MDETPAPTHGKLRFVLTVFNEHAMYGIPSMDDFPVHEVSEYYAKSVFIIAASFAPAVHNIGTL